GLSGAIEGLTCRERPRDRPVGNGWRDGSGGCARDGQKDLERVPSRVRPLTEPLVHTHPTLATRSRAPEVNELEALPKPLSRSVPRDTAVNPTGEAVSFLLAEAIHER